MVGTYVQKCQGVWHHLHTELPSAFDMKVTWGDLPAGGRPTDQ